MIEKSLFDLMGSGFRLATRVGHSVLLIHNGHKLSRNFSEVDQPN
ncbi:hypothetical protein [Rhodoferax sp.]|jgi:hypothetical protein|nr:hypothetical protein [Rhodoferax sp.]